MSHVFHNDIGPSVQVFIEFNFRVGICVPDVSVQFPFPEFLKFKLIGAQNPQ